MQQLPAFNLMNKKDLAGFWKSNTDGASPYRPAQLEADKQPKKSWQRLYNVQVSLYQHHDVEGEYISAVQYIDLAKEHFDAIKINHFEQKFFSAAINDDVISIV